MPYLFGDHRIVILDVPITYDRMAQVVIALAVAFGLRTLLFRTPIGAQMRGVVDDPELARLSGVRSIVVARLSWMLGFMLAALGGVLFAGGENLNAIVLTLLVLNAYGAAMVGRLTSLPMTFVGALILGLLQELTNVTWLWPDGELFSRIRLAIPGIFLIAAVLLVPSFRLSAGRVVGRDQPRVPSLGRAAVAGAVLVGTTALFVNVGPDAAQPYVVRALVIATIALSLVALTGLSGQVSLTQYLFVGLGVFVAAKTFGGQSVLGVLAGGLVAGAAGALAALPAVRLRGLHLALSTFGIALIGREVVLGDSRVFGSGLRTLRTELPGISLESDAAFATWCAVVFAAPRPPRGRRAPELVRPPADRHPRQRAGRGHPRHGGPIGQGRRLRPLGLRRRLRRLAVRRVLRRRGPRAVRAHQRPRGPPVRLRGRHHLGQRGPVAGALFSLLVYAQAELADLSGLVFIAIGVAAIGLGRQPNGLAGMAFARARSRRRRSRRQLVAAESPGGPA